MSGIYHVMVFSRQGITIFCNIYITPWHPRYHKNGICSLKYEVIPYPMALDGDVALLCGIYHVWYLPGKILPNIHGWSSAGSQTW